MANPYSAERYASRETFCGYGELPGLRRPGTWTLDEIVATWLDRRASAPSFWVVGDRKLGKTSLLLRLDYLLRRDGQSLEGRGARLAVALYLSCKGLSTLAEFYAALLRRAAEVLDEPAGWHIDASGFALARIDPQRSDLELLDLAAKDLGLLAGQVTLPGQGEPRIVLLLDDVGAVPAQWAGQLFEHLRTLLTEDALASNGAASRHRRIVVALASDRSLADDERARALLELLDERPVRSLAASEVSTLPVAGALHRWWPQIYQATGGHPWLVQFVMQQVVESFGADDLQNDRLFKTIITERFQESAEATEILADYLKGLREQVQILAHLTLCPKGVSLAALAAKMGEEAVALRERLEGMVENGILYRKPGSVEELYVLGEIFMHWFVAHTGSGVLLGEIEQLQQGSELQALNVPFTLTLGLDPEFLLVDGRYARLLTLPDRFKTHHLSMIDFATQNEAPEQIGLNLEMALSQRDWEPMWKDYAEKCAAQHRQPRFVLRAADKVFYSLPIDLTMLGNQFLALQAPVYVELMAERQEAAYRLATHPLPLRTALNVLVVGSGRDGTLADKHYPGLRLVDQEVRDVVEMLRAAGPESGLQIGQITALVEPAEGLPEGVSVYEPSAANLDKALRGDLGPRFHLFHYCGHYIPNDRDDEGGLALSSGAGIELFSLNALRDALAQTVLKFACLSACSSAGNVQMSGRLHLGAAHTVLSAGVPAVVGMRWSITDSQGLSVSRAFYPQLLKSGVPDLALLEARRQLHRNGGGSTLWAAPVMLTR